jgi:hypothetical protein
VTTEKRANPIKTKKYFLSSWLLGFIKPMNSAKDFFCLKIFKMPKIIKPKKNTVNSWVKES